MMDEIRSVRTWSAIRGSKGDFWSREVVETCVMAPSWFWLALWAGPLDFFLWILLVIIGATCIDLPGDFRTIHNLR